jgi:esterase/lipase
MIWDYQHLISRRLLLWSFISVVAGLLVFGRGDFWRGFAIQAFVWAGVDALIALFGLRSSLPKLFQPVDLTAAEKETKKLRKILWINTGLDVLYITGGSLLYVLQGAENPFLAGTAAGIIIQGGFLFLFDLWHALHTPIEKPLPDLGIFKEAQHATTDLPGEQGAVLLVHGFPGSPAEMTALGEALNSAGWHVRLLRLPGHGTQFARLFQTRVSEWLDEVEKNLNDLRRNFSPVLLMGYSLGGGISLAVASRSKPDGLILLSPFWKAEPWWVKWLAIPIRTVLPVSIYPFRTRWLRPEQFRAASTELLPGFNLDDPQVRRSLMDIRLPMVFLEQFRRLSQLIIQGLRNIEVPTLVVQGKYDPVVLPSGTKALIRQIRAPLQYVETQGDHNINQRSNRGYAETESAVLKFADQFQKSG